MNPLSAEQQIIEAQKSPDLRAILHTIQQQMHQNEPRFTADVWKELGRVIVFRNHASSLLELTHMVRVAQACEKLPERFAGLFWAVPVARPWSFHRYLQKHLPQPMHTPVRMRLTTQGVEIDYADGQFTVYFSRMPFLAALMEFLMTSGGYTAWGERFRTWLAGPSSRKNADACASELRSLVNDFLNAHLPTEQQQRKFRRLIGFMKQRHGGDFSLEDFNDEGVLEFWLQKHLSVSEDNEDMKTFRNVAYSFMDLYRALVQATDQHQLEVSDSLTRIPDREGEFMVEHEKEETCQSLSEEPTYELDEQEPRKEVAMSRIYAMACEDAWEEAPHLALRNPPMASIEFLRDTEGEDVAFWIRFHRYAAILPRTCWRLEVFAPTQKRIGMALGKTKPEEIQTLIEKSILEDYEKRHKNLLRRQDSLLRTLQAILHILLTNRHKEGIGLLLAMHPKLDLQSLKRAMEGIDNAVGNVVMLSRRRVGLSKDGLVDHFFNSLTGDGPFAQKMGPILALAKKGHATKINRDGFKAEDLCQEEVLEGFAQAIPHVQRLIRLVAVLSESLTRLAPDKEDREALFTQDRAIFIEKFRQLYEGVNP
ncbi:hypothetical protein SIID45300_02242 [Candidatus Magnetaquicoccaceae bacterium FCR-1]|uniref:Uncharacterized protein n=1 Tax=Candidatus Magnetaquiglobus chichijimensis TaxID=3141448 RepID=A0ABQ0CAK9_9PROT